MSNILDRLNRELETFGRKAQAAIDEGKLQIELMRLRRQQANAARDLGLLVHRRERAAGDTDQRRYDSLILRLDDLEREIGRLEREIAAAKGETVSVSDDPAPTAVTTVDAEAVDPAAAPRTTTGDAAGEQSQPV